MGFLKKFARTLFGTAGGFLVGGPLGAVAGGYAGMKQDEKFGERRASVESDAAAAAAIKQAEFEASQREGFERLSLKRRKGRAASMIVDPGSALGSSSTLGS